MRSIQHLVCCLFIFLSLSLSVLAGEITLAEMDKLQKAAVLASRVMDKTHDVTGAIRVLEEANISKVLNSRPSNYPVGEYVKLLYIYAKCLFQTQSRFKESEAILKTVLNLKPDDYHANFLYADFNYRLYKQTKGKAYRQRASQYYQKYAEVLRKNELVTALPARALEMIYGKISGGVCGFVADRLSQNKESELYRFLNPESNIETLDELTQAGLGKLKLGALFESFLMLEGGPIKRSFVDINNDGVKEVRYNKESQLHKCSRNLFYKPGSEKDSHLGNELLARFYETGGSCEDREMSFLQYDNKVYIFEKRALEPDDYKYSVYKLEKDNSWESLCDFSGGASIEPGKYEVKLVCDHEVCRDLLNKADEIILSEGKHGFEKRVSSERLLAFKQQQYTDELRPFVDSKHIYEADINNDGTNEFISRLWSNDGQGNMIYQFRLFRKNMQNIWGNFYLSSIKDDDWIFIESFNGINYIVALEMLKVLTPDQQEYMTYHFQIYHLQGDEFQDIGSIRLNEK